MATFEVEFGPEGGDAVVFDTVKASGPYEAMTLVLEPFKQDPRVADSKTWHVVVRRVSDA